MMIGGGALAVSFDSYDSVFQSESQLLILYMPQLFTQR